MEAPRASARGAFVFKAAALWLATLIIWKTDRLGRDRYDLAIAKKYIRDALLLFPRIALRFAAAPEQYKTIRGQFSDFICLVLL